MSTNQVSLQDQFRTLSNPDPGNWDPLPKAVVLVAIFVLVLIVVWFLWCSSQLDDLENARKQEEELRSEYVTKKAKAINLDAYKKQRDEIQTSFEVLLKQLPDKTEVKDLLVEVNQAGLGRGLQFELFQPGNEVKREFYADLPITVHLTGVYNDLGAFAADIARLPRIVTLNDLDIAPVKPNVQRLRTKMIVRTFRYLSADELTSKQGGKK